MEENPARRWTREHRYLSEPPRRTFFPQHTPTTVDQCNVVQVTIDMVPDVALIEIFDFYMTEALGYDPFRHNREAWIILAHVCRKWRDIVFGSPSRLNLRLHFTAWRSVRMMLDTWPPFPIEIWGDGADPMVRDVGNIVAALEHNDRIHKIELSCSSKSIMEQALAAMQKPFPSLTELAVNFFNVSAKESAVLVVPDLILSGSAPLLRSLRLRSILPALRNLLLSATNLVELRILGILRSGYIYPEEMTACLSGLTRLEEFELGFEYPAPWDFGIRLPPPPPTPCVLPVLTSLRLNVHRGYLEHLISPIDTPLLDNLDVILYDPRLNTPQLARFVDRTPKLKALREARLYFDRSNIFISFPWSHRRGLHLRISRTRSDLSVIVQLCTSPFLRTLIPMTKQLYILDTGMPSSFWLNNVRSSQWLDLLRLFTTVEDLYLSREFSPHIVPTLLQITGERMTGVLPSLQNLFLERPSSPGPIDSVEAIEQSDLSDRPITVSQWGRVRDVPWSHHEDR
jgi:hypothetical protein